MGTAVLLATWAAPAHAASDEAPDDGSIREAVQEVQEGHPSEADLEVVLWDPLIAAGTVDPRLTETEIHASAATSLEERFAGVIALAPEVRAAAYCKTVTVTKTYRTVLGNVAFRWRHTAEFCYDKSTVYTWKRNQDLVYDKDPFFRVGEVLVSRTYNVGHSTSSAEFQRSVENCVIKYGCFGETTPYSKVTGYASGNYSVETHW